MNKEQLLELGLSEEQANGVIKGFGETIPKYRFDQKNMEVKKLKDQLLDGTGLIHAICLIYDFDIEQSKKIMNNRVSRETILSSLRDRVYKVEVMK